MNALIIRCLLVCTLLSTIIPYNLRAGDTIVTSTPEIIIVNYDQMSDASLTDLAIYISKQWSAVFDNKITVTTYTDLAEEVLSEEINQKLIGKLINLGVSQDRISLKNGKNPGSSAYFSISIASDASIQ